MQHMAANSEFQHILVLKDLMFQVGQAQCIKLHDTGLFEKNLNQCRSFFVIVLLKCIL